MSRLFFKKVYFFFDVRKKWKRMSKERNILRYKLEIKRIKLKYGFRKTLP